MVKAGALRHGTHLRTSAGSTVTVLSGKTPKVPTSDELREVARDINGLDKLVRMLPEDHAGITEAWRIWKVGLKGGMPSEAEILAQRDYLSRIYWPLMVSP